MKCLLSLHKIDETRHIFSSFVSVSANVCSFFERHDLVLVSQLAWASRKVHFNHKHLVSAFEFHFWNWRRVNHLSSRLYEQLSSASVRFNILSFLQRDDVNSELNFQRKKFRSCCSQILILHHHVFVAEIRVTEINYECWRLISTIKCCSLEINLRISSEMKYKFHDEINESMAWKR